MIKNSVKVLMTILLLVVVTIITPVGVGAAETQPKYGDTFIVGMNSDPATLNGAISGSVNDKTVASNIFSMLFRLDYKMNPVPDLAEEWTISDDGLVYTFKLRDGVKWHDGTPFTSADVKFSMDEAYMKLHPRTDNFNSFIESVETPDDKTVVFKLKKPYGAFMNALAYDVYIIPKHLYENTDIRNNPYNIKPIGTGPFIFEEWSRGSHITLKRNPDYFQKGLPYLDKLVFRIIPNAASRVLALGTGEIHYLSYQALPSSAIAELKENPDIKITTQGFESLGSMLMLTLNLEQPKLQDIRVRQALAMGIDRKYIVEHADYGMGVPATGAFPSTNWAYEPDVIKYEYNPEKAMKLLDEAGFVPDSNGVRLTLRLTADANVELARKGGEIIKANLEKIGVVVDFEPVERGVMLDRTYISRDFDMQIHSFSTGSDPAVDIARFYVSSNIRPVTFTNGSAYRNPEVDALFTKGADASSIQERAKYYKEVQKILSEDLPIIWIEEVGLVGAYNSRFHNVHSWSSYSYYVFWDVWSDSGVIKTGDTTETAPSTTTADKNAETGGISVGTIIAVVGIAAIGLAVMAFRKRRSSEDDDE